MYANVVVPIDLEHEGSWVEAIKRAAMFAKLEGATVHLLTVIHAGPAVVAQFLPGGYEQRAAADVRAELDRLAADTALEKEKTVTTVRFGTAHKEILAYAKQINADLIIIGSHRPDVADILLGSNAASVVRHATCSVFVVR